MLQIFIILSINLSWYNWNIFKKGKRKEYCYSFLNGNTRISIYLKIVLSADLSRRCRCRCTACCCCRRRCCWTAWWIYWIFEQVIWLGWFVVTKKKLYKNTCAIFVNYHRVAYTCWKSNKVGIVENHSKSPFHQYGSQFQVSDTRFRNTCWTHTKIK